MSNGNLCVRTPVKWFSAESRTSKQLDRSMRHTMSRENQLWSTKTILHIMCIILYFWKKNSWPFLRIKNTYLNEKVREKNTSERNFLIYARNCYLPSSQFSQLPIMSEQYEALFLSLLENEKNLNLNGICWALNCWNLSYLTHHRVE